MDKTSSGFQTFLSESGEYGKSYMDFVMKSAQSSALDPKTRELAYISVLAAQRMSGGLDFHIHSALQLGASKEEIKSAILVGMPAVGLAVLDAFEIFSEVTAE